MKKATSIFLSLLILSCSDSKENSTASKTQLDSEAIKGSTNDIKTSESSHLVGASNQENMTETADLASLKGKVFVLGAGINDNTCEITEACDCCNADLMFITEKEFIYDDLCEGHYVRKGNYRVVGNQITLKFEPKLVSFYHNEESEKNPQAPESILKSESKSTKNETYTIGSCERTSVITNNNKSEDIAFPIGVLKGSSKIEEKVSILKQIGIWKMLELK